MSAYWFAICPADGTLQAYGPYQERHEAEAERQFVAGLLSNAGCKLTGVFPANDRLQLAPKHRPCWTSIDSNR